MSPVSMTFWADEWWGLKGSSLLAGLCIYKYQIKYFVLKKKKPYTANWHDPTLQDGSTYLNMEAGADHKQQNLHLQGNIYPWVPQDHHWLHYPIVEHLLLSLPIQWEHNKIEEKIDMQKCSFGRYSLFGFCIHLKVILEILMWLPSIAPRASLEYGQNFGFCCISWGIELLIVGSFMWFV